MKPYRKVSLLLLASSVLTLSLAPNSDAQFRVVQEPLPRFLSAVADAELMLGESVRIQIVGIADSIGAYRYNDGYRVPFYWSRDASGSSNTFFISDTGLFWNDGLHGEEHRYSKSAAVDDHGYPFFLWSKQNAILSDIPPFTHLSRPHLRSFLRNNFGISVPVVSSSSLNPIVVSDGTNAFHFTWETVNYTRSDSNFVSYRSILQYRHMTSGGVLSPPQTIDSGYKCQMTIDRVGTTHLVWAKADSSTATVFQLKYRSVMSGVMSPIVTLRSAVYKPQGLTAFVDSTVRVHVGWAEQRTTDRAKVFVLRMHGATIEVDSSEMQRANAAETKFQVHRDGVIHVAWVTRGSGVDTIKYTTSRATRLFTNERSFVRGLRFPTKLSTVLKSDSIVGCLFEDGSRIKYIRNLASNFDSAYTIVSPGAFYRNALHRAQVDDHGDIRFLFATDLTYYGDRYRQIWLGTIIDEPTTVGEYTFPNVFSLQQNYPNPFNPTTRIEYAIPKTSRVSLKVFDLLGREVATLVDEVQDPGLKSAEFDASKLVSGVYFYTLRAGGYLLTKKFILVR